MGLDQFASDCKLELSNVAQQSHPSLSKLVVATVFATADLGGQHGLALPTLSL